MAATASELDGVSGARQHFIDLPNLRMHCVTMGPETGTPVILLHGFPEFWYSWRLQMPALAAAGYRVIAPDQRGYNLTDKRGPYDIGTLTDDIAHLQDALGISSCHIVGHDWGGVVAWAFAAHYPERVQKLVVLNAPHMKAYYDALRRPSRQIFMSWYILFFQLPRLPEWAIRRNQYAAVRKIFAGLPKEHTGEHDIDRYVEALKHPGALTAAINWYRALRKRESNTRKRHSLKMPVCLIWGMRDFALSMACNKTLPKYVADLETHYLPDSTHWVQLDAPETVNEILLEFLGK